MATLVLPVTPEARTPSELRLDLPSLGDPTRNAWAAGIYAVSARVTRQGAERISNAVPLALAPSIVSITPNPAPRDATGKVTLDVGCQPRVLPEQRASLLLDGREIRAEALTGPSDTLTFVVADAPAVTNVLVRLRIDDVYSQPFTFDDASQRYAFDDGQRVTIT
jgi:hypothetical protein